MKFLYFLRNTNFNISKMEAFANVKLIQEIVSDFEMVGYIVGEGEYTCCQYVFLSLLKYGFFWYNYLTDNI